MNANVATYQLTPGERDAAQRAAPRLTVVGSSALLTERRLRAALPAPVVCREGARTGVRRPG